MMKKAIPFLLSVVLGCGVAFPPRADAEFLVNDCSSSYRYTATASQTAFSYPCEFEAAEDLVVLQDNAGDGNFVTLVEDTDYTVTGASTNGGGTVTLTTGATAGDVVVIHQDMDVDRTTDFVSTITAPSLNLALDRLTLMAKKHEDWLTKRALMVPYDDITGTSNVSVVLDGNASKCLKAKSDETGIEFGTCSSGTGSDFDGGSFATPGDSVQLRRGSLATRRAATLAAGECGWDTTDEKLYCGDGTTAGGVDVSGYPYIDVKAYGATGDGTTDDTTAVLAAVSASLAANACVLFPDGTYKITDSIDLSSGYGCIVGMAKPTILMTDLTEAIVIAGERSRVENLVLRYSTRPSSSDTGATGIQAGKTDGSGTGLHHGQVRNVEILQTFVGIKAGGLTLSPISESDSLTGGWFSNTFDNVVIRDFGYSAIWHNVASGADTGDVWNNIYINGKEWDSEDKVVPTGPVIYLAQYSNAVFNQLNIEWVGDSSTPTSYDNKLLYLTAGNTESHSLVFNSVHVEGVYSSQSGGAFFRMGENSNVQFNAMEVNVCTFAPGAGNFYNLFLFGDDDTKVLVNGLALRTNTVSSGTFRQSATNGTKSGNSLEVRGFTTADNDTSILTVSAAGNTVGDGVPLLRRWNDTVYYTDLQGVVGFAPVPASKTIASGAITVTTENHVTLVPESGTSDTLTSISGGSDNQLLWLEVQSNGRTIYIQHGSGIVTRDNATFVMSNQNSRMLLQYNATTSKWAEVSRAGNNYLHDRTRLGGLDTLTIATGVIAPTGSYHTVATEGGAASDDLGAITPDSSFAGWLLALRAADTDDTVVLKNGTGNINGGADCTLDSSEDLALLLYDNALSSWQIISCKDNG